MLALVLSENGPEHGTRIIAMADAHSKNQDPQLSHQRFISPARNKAWQPIIKFTNDYPLASRDATWALVRMRIMVLPPNLDGAKVAMSLSFLP